MKIFHSYTFICWSFLLFGFLLVTEAEKTAFYKVLSSNKEETIVNYRKKLAVNLTSYDAKAYHASLIMKEAKFALSPFTKLERFNKGKELLESVIALNKNNPEYRFLRLMVQENAPSMLGYNNELQQDAKLIIKQYDDLSEAVKTVIINYSRTSEKLPYSKIKQLSK
jgi:hypothetical protein